MDDCLDSFFVDIGGKFLYYVPYNLVVIEKKDRDYEIKISPDEIRQFDESWRNNCIDYGFDKGFVPIGTSVRILPILVERESIRTISDLCFESRMDDAKVSAILLYDAARTAYMGER